MKNYPQSASKFLLTNVTGNRTAILAIPEWYRLTHPLVATSLSSLTNLVSTFDTWHISAIFLGGLRAFLGNDGGAFFFHADVFALLDQPRGALLLVLRLADFHRFLAAHFLLCALFRFDLFTLGDGDVVAHTYFHRLALVLELPIALFFFDVDALFDLLVFTLFLLHLFAFILDHCLAVWNSFTLLHVFRLAFLNVDVLADGLGESRARDGGGRRR